MTPEQEAGWSWSDIGHGILDVAGLIPGYGEAADIANTVWYAAEGNYLDAGLSLISVIPVVGDIIGKGGKLATKLGPEATQHVLQAVRKLDIPAFLERFRGHPQLGPHIDKIAEALKKWRDDLEAMSKRDAGSPKEPCPKCDEAASRKKDAEANPDAKAEAKALEDAKAQLGPDGKFKDASLEDSYQKYVARKETRGDAPRDRAQWKVERDYWLNDSPMARGNNYNTSVKERDLYDYHEVHLANGKRLDSYVPPSNGKPGEIISRKATDFDNIEQQTFGRYLDEMKNKYEPGTVIRSNKYEYIDGQPLQGRQILEVPDSNLNAANRQAFEEIARSKGIEIRYTPE